jgi:hypothetical protein
METMDLRLERSQVNVDTLSGGTRTSSVRNSVRELEPREAEVENWEDQNEPSTENCIDLRCINTSTYNGCGNNRFYIYQCRGGVVRLGGRVGIARESVAYDSISLTPPNPQLKPVDL